MQLYKLDQLFIDRLSERRVAVLRQAGDRSHSATLSCSTRRRRHAPFLTRCSVKNAHAMYLSGGAHVKGPALEKQEQLFIDCLAECRAAKRSPEAE